MSSDAGALVRGLYEAYQGRDWERAASFLDTEVARVAAEVEVTARDAVYRCAAFWRSRDGLLADGVEYWVQVGGEQPPPYRRDIR